MVLVLNKMLHASPLTPPRARGALRARFERVGAATRIDRLFEAGGVRLRFPRAGAQCEAVIVNTAGGVVGGDSARYDFALGATSQALLTTQSAEKIYRSDGPNAEIAVNIDVGAGGKLDWLPQECILFDGARLDRRLCVDLAADADALLLEATIFGRLAMGETVRDGRFHDSWRIRRAGRLVFAEETLLDGDMMAKLDRLALGGGARSTAVLLLAAPRAETRLEALRGVLAGAACLCAASAQDNLLIARFLSPSPASLRAALVASLRVLRGMAAPRVWQ